MEDKMVRYNKENNTMSDSSVVTMVPHIGGVDFPLTEEYVILKGTIVFPSSFLGFTEPEQFDPDRFMEEREEGRVYKRKYLAFGFGAGAHQYAINHLMLFIAFFSTLIDFNRDRIDGCDGISYVPTIVPKDDCRVFSCAQMHPDSLLCPEGLLNSNIKKFE